MTLSFSQAFLQRAARPGDVRSIVHSSLHQLEAFVYISPRARSFPTLPQREFLLRLPRGMSAEVFFSQLASFPDLIVPMDHAIISKVFDTFGRGGDRLSINLNPATCFNFELLDFLRTAPEHDPRNFCIEITEQGWLEVEHNPQLLKNLSNAGYMLALDDFHPDYPMDWERLYAVANFISIVKFPYQVAEILREGPSAKKENMISLIKTAREFYPEIITVMEGVRRTGDHTLIGLLKDIGIDVVQISSYSPALNGSSPHAQPIVRDKRDLELIH